ncbi:hypothetical protein GCM10027059_50240 [Myceligenerans halotolerans]
MATQEAPSTHPDDLSPDRVLFESVRTGSLAALRRAFRDEDGYERYCEWQDGHDSHVAIYCNAMSNVKALEDLLQHGTWCDDVELVEGLTVEDDPFDASQANDDRLFRYYTQAFNDLAPCLTDLRTIANSTKAAKLPIEADSILGFINNVWNHRSREQGQRPAFHKTHHHGPYVFADCPGYEAVLPADGVYLAIDHSPSKTTQPVPLVVPSLRAAMSAFGTAIAHIDNRLKDEQARSAVEAEWGEAKTIVGSAT